MVGRLTVTLLTTLALALATPATGAAADCPAADRCGTVTVPLDRTAAVPGKIPLRYAVVRGRDKDAAPLVLLPGGPGQAGLLFTRDWNLLLGLTDVRRTFVTVDTRGTGGSGLLRCPAFERALDRSPAASGGGCGTSLGAARSFYRSADSADDLDALRRRLGVDRIAILAVSYGTRIAVEYARRYPDHTDRVILDSAVDDGTDAMLAETFEAVPRVLRAVCRFGCPGGGPHPLTDLHALADDLREDSERVVLQDGTRVRFDADELLGMLVTTDLDPGLMQRFPGAVRAALQGRLQRFTRLEQAAAELNVVEPPRAFSSALYAATLCEESPLVWNPATAPAERRREALAALAARPLTDFAPFGREEAVANGLLPLCGDWPAPTRAPLPAPPAATPVPILVLSGQLDLRTPLEAARRLAARLGNATVVTAPGVGHSVYGADLDGCATRAVAVFLRGQRPDCADNTSASATGASKGTAWPTSGIRTRRAPGIAAARR
ncbi:MAG: alpha/beta fold hydrolase [Solirubrobacteraceae bacterium]|nr:alpha/beta fold hydrolase [Solirubrobacteraceae bacterium]